VPYADFGIRHDIAVVSEVFVADCTFSILVGDLSVQQLSHLRWRPEFPISPRVMRVFYTLHSEPQAAFSATLFTAAAEQRAMDRAQFIPAKFHGIPPE
jgi:hypothetical protein